MLFFPVGVLSSLSGESRWAFFQPKLVADLARVAPTALGFYAVTPLLFAVVLGLWSAALTAESSVTHSATAMCGDKRDANISPASPIV